MGFIVLLIFGCGCGCGCGWLWLWLWLWLRLWLWLWPWLWLWLWLWLIFGCVLHGRYLYSSTLVKPFAHQSLSLVMAILSVAAYERQPLAAQHKTHERQALAGSSVGLCEELAELGSSDEHVDASIERQPLDALSVGLCDKLAELGSSDEHVDASTERQLLAASSVGLCEVFAELESSDEHVDASISPSPGVAEEVAEQRQNERRDSSSEFPTHLQRPSPWWLRLLATLALLAFSLQWLHSQLGQDSQDYFYEIGVFADASVAKGEAVNHRTASPLRVVMFTGL
jgi:hypothetical protein